MVDDQRRDGVDITVAPIIFRVTADDDGCRLDKYLALQLPEHSRSRLATWIQDGQVQVNDRDARPKTRVTENDQVCVTPPKPRAHTLAPQEIDLETVYHDEHIIVVDKTPNLVVHPGAGNPDGTVINGLIHQFGPLSSIGLPSRPGVVHRIDKGTSGLLVFARTDAAHTHLAKQFSDHCVERRYRALVWDHGLRDEGTIETPAYGRHPRDRRKFTAALSTGKRAVTHWRVLERIHPCTWVELSLETGRTHQIRVHMSEAGQPLVGDPMYGRRRRVEKQTRLRQLGFEFGLTRQALHAATLGFVHPATGEMVRFESHIASDIQSVLDILRDG